MPTIEKEIDDWTQKAKELPAEVITDIQQGNAWKQLSWTNSWDDLRLVFSLFVDWFNPRGKKLAGKQESVGLIAMNCLNLPPKIRNKLAYTFVAGITPGPDSPSMTTITHLLKPLIDELVDLAEPFRLPTPSHPSGRLCQVKLLPLVGDLGGTHKVAGYASHSAKYYCSLCSSTNDKRPLLKIGDPRDGVEVHILSDLWKSTQTLNGREKILRETGIRYSELNWLSYRDPVQHVALGILHNWFEGVLMHHFRERWGFQSLSFKEKRRQGDHQTSRKRARLDPSAPADDSDSSLESSSEDDNDVNLNQGANGGLFNEKDMDYFRNAMQDVVLPTKVGHLPSELGKSKCGKLKASQWYILFVYVVPLIVGEIFLDTLEDIDSNSNRFLIMENISNLIACTHYVASRKIRESHKSSFSNFYKIYTRTSTKIFQNLVVQPNHHYALHIPEQLSLWGPMMGVAEFSGERLIGRLQGFQTNRRTGELEGTLLKTVSRIQRLEANEDFIKFVNVINKESKKRGNGGRKVKLDDIAYERLLAYLQRGNPNVKDY